MARNTRSHIKKEASPTPVSLTGSQTMGPPSRILPPVSQSGGVGHSVAQSFIRSGAPSVTTYHQPDEEPMLMQITRIAQPQLNGSFEESTQNADSSFAHQSFVHPTFTDISKRLKAFNDTHANLQRLGVAHETAAKLPELVLVGDQSAGKSSLMCGIARVNIPRSAGVGTRCPLHIQLSENTHWSCTVTLQLDYDFRPKGKIRKADVTAANPFPPWVKKPLREIKFFKTISEPNEIEEVLRWAQIAILNPSKTHEMFVPGQGAMANSSLAEATQSAEAQFSPNIISLQIKGPDFFNLSFYDLPGVFLAPELEEDEYIVKVVRNLSREYIQREKAIIMWALPMNADPENSISLGIIREAKATARTIGVMTKADMLVSDNEPQWLAMFRKEKQSVGHGFFATCRRPNDSLEAANKWEELFFNHEVASWPVSFDDYKQRCGVDHLSNYISDRLGHAFAESLPDVKRKVHQGLDDIDRQLRGLPELPSNVEHEVKKSLYEFFHHMKEAMKEAEFASQWVTLNNQFKDIIYQIKPTCRVKEPSTQTIDLSDADTEVSVATPSRRPRPSDSTVRPTPTKRARQGPADQPMTPVKQETPTHPGVFPPSRAMSVISNTPFEMGSPSPFIRFRNLGRGQMAMDIREIRAEVRRKQRPGMPRDLVPDKVREELCLNAVRRWESPLEAYITKTAELVEQATRQVLEKALGNLRRRLIFKECEIHLKTFIDTTVAHQRGRLHDMFNSETYQMYMMNEDAFTRYKAQELEILRRARAIYRLKAVVLVEWEYEIKKAEEMSDEDRVKEHKMLAQNLPKIGPDPFETEIEVAAFVRGYYMMAATRFVEGITMNVNSYLLRMVGSADLDMYMDHKLRINDSSVYSHLMEEDEHTARLREQLKDRKNRLTEAMQSIHDLETASSGSTIDNNSFMQAPGPVHVDLDEVDDDDEGAA